jgi:hypothetical protein
VKLRRPSNRVSSPANPIPTPFLTTRRRLFALLDRYVESLHNADILAKRLVARHPELGRLLACLESLDSSRRRKRLSCWNPQSQTTRAKTNKIELQRFVSARR